mmetsp:Transcript_19628/g.50289  ORF Transcript_19628/g.50289 Transcript_19628/m.50289 type:complete len:115 (-) Transcript_19628:174-518(-)
MSRKSSNSYPPQAREKQRDKPKQRENRQSEKDGKMENGRTDTQRPLSSIRSPVLNLLLLSPCTYAHVLYHHSLAISARELRYSLTDACVPSTTSTATTPSTIRSRLLSSPSAST